MPGNRLNNRPRNPVARSPLLRRGGVHEKSNSAARQQQRATVNALLDDWRDELEFERELRSGSPHQEND